MWFSLKILRQYYFPSQKWRVKIDFDIEISSRFDIYLTEKSMYRIDINHRETSIPHRCLIDGNLTMTIDVDSTSILRSDIHRIDIKFRNQFRHVIFGWVYPWSFPLSLRALIVCVFFNELEYKICVIFKFHGLSMGALTSLVGRKRTPGTSPCSPPAWFL